MKIYILIHITLVPYVALKRSLKNKVTTFKTWSTFHENVRYLTNVDIDDKKNILLEQSECMATTMVGQSTYPPEIIRRAFEYFATSRELYMIN